MLLGLIVRAPHGAPPPALPLQVVRAVETLDCGRLHDALVRELRSNMPEEAELAALYAYLDAGEDVAELGPAEQLFAALRGVARLEQKLQVRGLVGLGPVLSRCAQHWRRQ